MVFTTVYTLCLPSQPMATQPCSSDYVLQRELLPRVSGSKFVLGRLLSPINLRSGKRSGKLFIRWRATAELATSCHLQPVLIPKKGWQRTSLRSLSRRATNLAAVLTFLTEAKPFKMLYIYYISFIYKQLIPDSQKLYQPCDATESFLICNRLPHPSLFSPSPLCGANFRTKQPLNLWHHKYLAPCKRPLRPPSDLGDNF